MESYENEEGEMSSSSSEGETKNKHDFKTKIECKICQMEFTEKSSRDRHENNKICKKVRICIKCDLCDKTVKTHYNL